MSSIRWIEGLNVVGDVSREVIEIVAGDLTLLSGDLANPVRIWTIYDEEEMFANRIEGSDVDGDRLEDLELKHLRGVFLEDRVHDWKIVSRDDGEYLHYYSRVVATGSRVKLLLEY